MHDFYTLYAELSAARVAYEDLRRSGAPLHARADALDTLNELRAHMGAVRRHLSGRI